MIKDILYSGAVEEWLAHFVFTYLKISYSSEKFSYYQVSEDFALYLGKDESIVIELERVKISTYYGYSVKLLLNPSSKKILLLEKEFYGEDEGYLVYEFTKSKTGISRKWLENYKGLKSWPR